MNYLLFAVYSIVFCWLLTKIPFVKKAGLGNRAVPLLFLLKIAAGIAIGWISLHQYGPGNDYWDVHREGWKEYQLLLSDPKGYFTNIFSSGYTDAYGGLFDSFHSFWNDLRNNIIIKLVSVFNIFSQGNYYVNSVFFNFIVFFGHVALYRVFIRIFEGRKWAVVIGCFLLPSLLYFSSGIHKDGIVFLLLALLCYVIFEATQKRGFSWKAILAILICLVFLFLVRNFVFIALVPALAAWVLSTRIKKPVWLAFSITYLIFGLVLFNIHAVFDKADPLAIIVQKQSDFLQLPHSATQIEVSRLQPTFGSFISNAPQSLNHLLLRPYIWEMPVKAILPLAIELLIYQLLFILFLFSRKKSGHERYKIAFLYFCIFFTFTAFLFIGYIVPNLGSLVRYRSLYLPFVITPLLCGIDWGRMKGLVR